MPIVIFLNQSINFEILYRRLYSYYPCPPFPLSNSSDVTVSVVKFRANCVWEVMLCVGSKGWGGTGSTELQAKAEGNQCHDHLPGGPLSELRVLEVLWSYLHLTDSSARCTHHEFNKSLLGE